MKTALQISTLLLFSGMCCAQTTNTVANGLNQNEVNVVRDGDFAAESGGVIKMVPSGQKAKVMTIVPDTLDGKPLSSSTATALVRTDSSIQFREDEKTKVIPITNKKASKKSSTVKTKKTNPK